MAITGALRGAGAGIKSGSASAVYFSPLANFNTGATAVVCLGYDNSAAGGADPFSTIADSKNNTWTLVEQELRDPGAANAGVTFRMYSTAQDGGTLTTGDIITVTYGTYSARTVFTLTEVVPDTGYSLTLSGNSGSNTNTNTPVISTPSLSSGMFVLGAVTREWNGDRAGDTDTVNGTWSVTQSFASGAVANGASVEIISQYKEITGTGTQSYNPTFGATSGDLCIAWAAWTQTLNVTAAPIFIKWTMIG